VTRAAAAPTPSPIAVSVIFYNNMTIFVGSSVAGRMCFSACFGLFVALADLWLSDVSYLKCNSKELLDVQLLVIAYMYWKTN